MSTIVTDISCTPYYTASLSYGIDCTQACDSAAYVTYYTDCSSLNIGCHLRDSTGLEATFGYYSDGTNCYEYGYAVGQETGSIISNNVCASERCACFGYSVTDCTEAGTNSLSC